MGATHYLKLDKLLQYLEERYVKENAPAVLFDRKERKILDVRDDVQQQRNGYDCGMFARIISNFVTRGVPLKFMQDHVHHCSKIIAWEILYYNGK